MKYKKINFPPIAQPPQNIAGSLINDILFNASCCNPATQPAVWVLIQISRSLALLKPDRIDNFSLFNNPNPDFTDFCKFNIPKCNGERWSDYVCSLSICTELPTRQNILIRAKPFISQAISYQHGPDIEGCATAAEIFTRYMNISV
jgi:hypothetical protein